MVDLEQRQVGLGCSSEAAEALRKVVVVDEALGIVLRSEVAVWGLEKSEYAEVDASTPWSLAVYSTKRYPVRFWT